MRAKRTKKLRRRLSNAVLLIALLAIIVGIAYNIFNSRAEQKVEINAVALDNYGYLEEEDFVLEAIELSGDRYEIELPESVNTKKVLEVIKVTLQEKVYGEAIIPGEEQEEISDENTIEVQDNKFQVTKEQLELNELNLEIKYDIALLQKSENNEFEKELLSEKTLEEIKALEITDETQVLYNKILKYEDEENGKLVEVKGFLPIDAELQTEQVSEQKLKEIFGDGEIDVAYDIKIRLPIVKEVPVDENNPESGMQEVIEYEEINPEDFGENCEVSIKDSKIVEDSQVYHVKEDNTFEQVQVKENEEESISFEAQTFSIYAVSSDKSIMVASGSNPTYTSAEVKNVSKEGYDVYIYGVNDGDGINRVDFPTWTSNYGQDDLLWRSGTDLGGGTWYFRVNASDHNNEQGWYITHIYIYDAAGNNTSLAVSGVCLDVTAPKIAVGSAASTLTAEDYGGYVTNYTPTNGVNDEGIKWRIFHTDGENIYLIADTYVPVVGYVPKGYSSISGTYGFDLAAYSNYNGTVDVAANIANKWLKKHADAGYTATNTEYNGKATAYLLDTNAWSGFKDSTYAEYAVGAPTLELFADSYNKTHTDRTIETKAVSELGYDVAWSDGSFGIYYIYGLNTSESLYVISNTFDDTVDGMWLASPSANGSYGMMRVSYGGVVGSDPYYYNYVRISPNSCSKI